MLNTLTRPWEEGDAARYIGPHHATHLAYAADEALRVRAASGGALSAFLIHLLESGHIDGALLVKGTVENGHFSADFFIARSREEIFSAQGSQYASVHFYRQALPLIRAFEGRIAVIALPCDATLLRRRMAEEPKLAQKIALIAGLFCGHNSEPALTDHVIATLQRERGSAVTAFRHRVGHWRGQMEATFADGSRVQKPFSHFSDYQNLYVCAERKCHACGDHFAGDADISFGDTWDLALRKHPIKHSCIILRSEPAKRWWDEAVSGGAIVAHPVPADAVLTGQARTLPFHANVSARARVGRLFGLKLKDDPAQRVSLNHYVVAFLALLNAKASSNSLLRRLIFVLPRPLLKAYLYCFKALEQLR